MGQNLDSMAQQQQHQTRSRAELLHEVVVSTGNVDAIKTLFQEGASLEWIDIEGKTPLIAACMNPNLLEAAKTLIQLGANLNAYRPGRQAGTPLHHAAKEGLNESVTLLLSHGANALVRNDDCQTPLDVARLYGHSVVVRLIEDRMCYFSGWFRQIYGPGFLEAVAQHLLTREIWVVVIPQGPNNNPAKPIKLELAVYSTLQDSQPSMLIQLWKARIEQPNLGQSDPTITIFDDSTKSRLKLAPGVRGDKRQLQTLYDACQGIPQAKPLPINHNGRTSVVQDAEVTTPSVRMPPPPPPPNPNQISEKPNTNGWEMSTNNNDSYNGWGSAVATEQYSDPITTSGWTAPDSVTNGLPFPLLLAAPSAPFIPEAVNNNEASTSNDSTEKDGRLCVVCWEAPAQGACVPCGHMAGCISCLTEIKSKEGLCPVCRSKIDRVVRLYVV